MNPANNGKITGTDGNARLNQRGSVMEYDGHFSACRQDTAGCDELAGKPVSQERKPAAAFKYIPAADDMLFFPAI